MRITDCEELGLEHYWVVMETIPILPPGGVIFYDPKNPDPDMEKPLIVRYVQHRRCQRCGKWSSR